MNLVQTDMLITKINISFRLSLKPRTIAVTLPGFLAKCTTTSAYTVIKVKYSINMRCMKHYYYKLSSNISMYAYGHKFYPGERKVIMRFDVLCVCFVDLNKDTLRG